MVQTRQLNGSNNTNATTVMTPMQCEDKEASVHWRNKSSNARAMLAMVPAQQGQQRHCDNNKDICASTMATMPL
jgi:hypothetical protein